MIDFVVLEAALIAAEYVRIVDRGSMKRVEGGIMRPKTDEEKRLDEVKAARDARLFAARAVVAMVRLRDEERALTS